VKRAGERGEFAALVIMAGRRSLTPLEERLSIAATRRMTPRDGCLVNAGIEDDGRLAIRPFRKT